MKTQSIIVLFFFNILSAQTNFFDEIALKYYLNENSTSIQFKDDISLINNYGVATLFVNPYQNDISFYNSEFLKFNGKVDLEKEIDFIKKNNLNLGLILPIFFDQSKKDSLHYLAENSLGEKANKTWQIMICPSNENYRNYKKRIILESVKKLKPNYIILDFIRFPVHWEEINVLNGKYNFEHFCFCENCKSKFLVYLDENSIEFNDKVDLNEIVYNNFSDWYKFRSSLISDFVKEIMQIIPPNVSIIINTLPWRQEFNQNAIYKIAGQNLANISMFSDYFSPMIYHKKIGAVSNFIFEILQNQSKFNPLFPAVQVGKINEEDYSKEDLKSILTLIKSKNIKKIAFFDFNRLKVNYTPQEFVEILNSK